MNFVSLYCSVSGRINRRTFWLAHIPYIVIFAAVNYTLIKLGVGEPILYIVNAVFFCLIVPLLVKRWHDLDKSAWYLVTYFIPIINIISLVELYFAAGDKEANSYGEPQIAT